MFLLFIIILVVAAYGLAVSAAPLLLARLGYGKTAFAVAVGTSAALTVDYLYNWEGITYPHGALGGFTQLFPFTILCAGGGVAVAFLAWLDQWEG